MTTAGHWSEEKWWRPWVVKGSAVAVVVMLLLMLRALACSHARTSVDLSTIACCRWLHSAHVQTILERDTRKKKRQRNSSCSEWTLSVSASAKLCRNVWFEVEIAQVFFGTCKPAIRFVCVRFVLVFYIVHWLYTYSHKELGWNFWFNHALLSYLISLSSFVQFCPCCVGA